MKVLLRFFSSRKILAFSRIPFPTLTRPCWRQLEAKKTGLLPWKCAENPLLSSRILPRFLFIHSCCKKKLSPEKERKEKHWNLTFEPDSASKPFQISQSSSYWTFIKFFDLPLRWMVATFFKIPFPLPSSFPVLIYFGSRTVNWQGATTDDFFKFGTTIFQGVRDLLPDNNVVYKRGCDIEGKSEPNELEETLAEARNSDVVVLAIGEDHYAERLGDIDGNRSLLKKKKRVIWASINT